MMRAAGRVLAVAATMLIGFGGCLDGPSGPSQLGVGTLVVQPYFSHAAVDEQFALYIDAFRVTVRSLETETVALDTVVVFPPGEDQVDFVGRIPLVLAVERFDVTVTLLSGETPLYEGTAVTELAADPAATTDPVLIPVLYVGPGTNIATIEIVPSDTALSFGDSLRYNVVAYDSAGEHVSAFYVSWRSSDSAIAAPDERGSVLAPRQRGGVVLYAVTGTGVRDSTPLTVQPLPVALVAAESDSLTGVVGENLPIGIRVLAADSLGVRGVPVRFSAGGVDAADVADTIVLTDSTGLAATTAVLGRQIGGYTVRAEVTDTLHGVELALDLVMTALAGPPARLVIEDGDGQTARAGEDLPDPLVVRVFDADSNPIQGQAVSFVVVSGGGAVYAGHNTTNEQGIAMERWTLGTSTAEPQRVEARAVDNETGDRLLFDVFTATVLPGAAASLTAESGDGQMGSVGSGLADSLGVRVRDQYGNPVPGVEVAWVTADGGDVTATSVTGTDGVARAAWRLGTVSGPQTVTAAAGGELTATFTATAVAGSVASLELMAGDGQTGTVGETLPDTLAVRATDEFGNPVAGVTLEWTVVAGGGSVAPLSATTDASGRALARWTLGTVAGANGLEVGTADGAVVTAFDAEGHPGTPAALRVAQSPTDAAAGDTLASLVAHVVDGYGNHVTSATPSVTASLAGGGEGLRGTTSVVAVNGTASFNDLQVTSAGAAVRLEVTADGLESATSAAFTVVPGPPATVTIETLATTFSSLGDEYRLTVTVADAYGNSIDDLVATWSTSDETVVTVDDQGLVASVANGTATVHVAVAGIGADLEFVVQQVVAAVTVDQTDLLFQSLGDQAQVSAVAEDANGFPVAGAAVSWSTNDAAVADVDANGLVTAEGNGTAEITATIGGVSASAAVTVGQVVAAVVVAPSSIGFAALGDQVQLTAAATDANGNPMAGTATWASSDEAVVTVSATGLVTAEGNGTAEITATIGGVSASGAVTVAQAVASVEVNPGTATLTGVGMTVQLGATVRDAGGSVVDGASVTWASSDALVASVNGSGLVTAVAEGEATISATAGGVSNTATVTVQIEIAVLEIVISIMPTLDPNSINLKKQGSVPVAILTTSVADGDLVTFDAAEADTATILFAGAAPLRWAFEDTDEDGDTDLILHFEAQALQLTPDSTQATLTGLTYAGVPFVGSDSVRITSGPAGTTAH